MTGAKPSSGRQGSQGWLWILYLAMGKAGATMFHLCPRDIGSKVGGLDRGKDCSECTVANTLFNVPVQITVSGTVATVLLHCCCRGLLPPSPELYLSLCA